MQQAIRQQLQRVIQERQLSAGDRLPAERQLAEELNVSRTSLRRALHILEGQGLVTIRQGSGTFLNPRFFLHGTGEAAAPSARTAAHQLEAAFLILPVMVELAATRQEPTLVARLQKINVALSRSMFSGEAHQVWKQSLAFFQRIAEATGNPYMVSIMEEICAVQMTPFDHFFEADRQTREKVFAGHVNILNALRQKDAPQAGQATRDYVAQLVQMVEADGTPTDRSVLMATSRETR